MTKSFKNSCCLSSDKMEINKKEEGSLGLIIIFMILILFLLVSCSGGNPPFTGVQISPTQIINVECGSQAPMQLTATYTSQWATSYDALCWGWTSSNQTNKVKITNSCIRNAGLVNSIFSIPTRREISSYTDTLTAVCKFYNKGSCQDSITYDTPSVTSISTNFALNVNCKKLDGQYCTLSAECSSLYCTNNKCSDLKFEAGDGRCDQQLGESCGNSQNDCSGILCNKQDASYCTTKEECLSGYCTNNKCSKLPYESGDRRCDSQVDENCANSPNDCRVSAGKYCNPSGREVACLYDYNCPSPNYQNNSNYCSNNNKDITQVNQFKFAKCVDYECKNFLSDERKTVICQNTLCQDGNCGCKTGFKECFESSQCEVIGNKQVGDKCGCNFQCGDQSQIYDFYCNRSTNRCDSKINGQVSLFAVSILGILIFLGILWWIFKPKKESVFNKYEKKDKTDLLKCKKCGGKLDGHFCGECGAKA